MDVLVEDTPSLDPVSNLGLEEALVRSEPPSPVLRVWQNSPCVVVGRGQRMEREVDLAACARDGVPVLRRASGGGAVYHDLGNLNVTVVVPGYRTGLAAHLVQLIAEVIRQYGLEPSIGVRGIHVGSTKVSGLASQVTRTGTLAHATVLVTTPAVRVGVYLAPAPAEPHPLDSRRGPVAPLRAYRTDLGVPGVQASVLAAAARRFGRLRSRPPRETELSWRTRLLRERYCDPSWHLTGRPREGSWMMRHDSICTG